jgi:bifunctional DNA-binding transcriptional regulator/antitoxin component of YhaV-PrlF toxin-antitoxin module
LSETILKVGKKGEIYVTKKIREKVGIVKDSFVKVLIKDGKPIIEPIQKIENLTKEKKIIELIPQEAEKISEEMQKEENVYG